MAKRTNLNDKFTFGEKLGRYITFPNIYRIFFPFKLSYNRSYFNIRFQSGSFATVVLAAENATGKQYAMKIIDKSKCRGQEEHIIKEITILKKISHKNIVKLYDVYETKDKLYLQME